MNKLLIILSLVLCTCCGSKKESDHNRTCKSSNVESVIDGERAITTPGGDNATSVEDGKSYGELYTLSGTLCIGHEVRSFKPDGSDDEYWIVDKTGKLNEIYDEVTEGSKNGKPARATLKLEYKGIWDDGFAAEYTGVYFVREVLSVELIK